MPEIRGHLLPIYVLIDESTSMQPNIGQLNAGLASLHDALLAEPMAAAKVRFSVIGFSDTAILRLHLADLREQLHLPQLACRNATSYGAAFNALLQQIPQDVTALKAQQYAVHRPAVFFLSDGQPTDGQRWLPMHAQLTNSAVFPAAPNIIAVGIGTADAATILRVATRPEFAFVSLVGADAGQAIARFSTTLTRSVVASGQSMSRGGGALTVERPEGFAMAIDVI